MATISSVRLYLTVTNKYMYIFVTFTYVYRQQFDS